MPDAVHLLPCYVVTLPLHIPTTTTTTTITATTPAGLRVQPKDFYLLACLPACLPAHLTTQDARRYTAVSDLPPRPRLFEQTPLRNTATRLRLGLVDGCSSRDPH